MIAGTAGLGALSGAGVFAISSPGLLRDAELVAITVALLVLGAGLVFRRAGTIPWAIALCAAAYVGGRERHGVVDAWAAVVGVLLLVAAELASWSIDQDPRVEPERALTARHALTIAMLAAAALVVDLGLLALTGVSASSQIVLAILGTTAAVGSVVLVLRLAAH